MPNDSGLNISTGLGEGAANVMQWGAVDRAANQLYQQQLYRRQLAQQNYLQQQGQFERELGKVRSVDIPDVVSAYKSRKQLKQQILFDKNLHKDPVKLAQTQLALRQADKDYYGLVNSSKETMDFDKGLSDDMAKNHDLYNPNAHTSFMQWQQMPTSKRREMGLLTPDPLLYNGQNTDWGAITKAAEGEPKEFVYGKETLTPDSQRYGTQYYSRGNQPDQFKELYIGQLSKRQASQDAAKKLNEISTQDYSDVNKAYDAISPEEYKKLWGKEKPSLNPNNPDNAADVLASYAAKKYALTNTPALSKTTYRDNEEYKLEQQKALEGIKQANKKELLQLGHQYKTMDKNVQNNYLDALINKQVDEAKSQGVMPFKTADGKEIKEYQLKISPLTKKIFETKDSNGNLVYPDVVRVMQNGDYHPIFWQRDDNGNVIITNGKSAVAKNLSQPISKNEYKIRLGQQLLSDKGLDKELNAEFGDEPQSEESGDKWNKYLVK